MLLLTSSVSSVAGHFYKKFLADKGYMSLLFIETAAEPEIADGDDEWFQTDLKSLKDLGYVVDRFTLTGKTKQEIENQVDTHDIVYVSGGNTAYLLDQLQKTDSLELIREKIKTGKTFIGSSAGSIITGPKIPLYLAEKEPKLDDYTAFGLVNFVVAPHWGSEAFRDEYVGKRIEIGYRTDQPPYILLNDLQYIHVDDDGRMNIVEVKSY
jgi:dipeptidase E